MRSAPRSSQRRPEVVTRARRQAGGERRFIIDLKREDMALQEDGEEQEIVDFYIEERPITLAVILDSSGSMLTARDRVAAAAAAFVETSNPQDEIFALAFNERVRAALPPAAWALMRYRRSEYSMQMSGSP